MDRDRGFRLRLSIAGAFLVILLGLPIEAWADQVKVGGFWISKVAVQDVVSGHLIYLSASGSEINQPLAKVQALKLDAYPDLNRAEDAISDKKFTEAIELFDVFQSRTRHPWLGQWVAARRVSTANHLGLATAAVNAYIELIEMDADPFFFERAPLESVEQASDTVKKQIFDRLESIERSRPDAVHPKFHSLLAKAKTIQARSAPHRNRETVLKADPGTVLEDSKAVLTRSIDNDDAITRLLRRGAFEQAIEAANEQLASTAQKLAMRLYQHGIAQLYLAEARKDLTLYKDAGLSFMRVIAHFPRSPYCGPALIEVGRVHQQIGRLDLAEKLYDRAKLVLDTKAEPELVHRLETFRKNLEVNP